MAVFVKTYQDNRKNGTKLFYGRAYHPQVINRDKLADRIQRNCSMKKSDVLAVLTELTEVMTDELQNSNTVLLDDFGYFRISVKTVGAMTEEDFNLHENVKGLVVRFRPTAKRSYGNVSRTFVQGCGTKLWQE